MALIRALGGGRGLSWGVNWTARADNLDDLENVCALAARYGADNVNVLRYKPGAGENYAWAALDSARTAELASRLRRIRAPRIEVDSAYACLLWTAAAPGAPPALPHRRGGCAAGADFIAVTADGAFKPCSHLPDRTMAAGIAD
jgi:MoaA/NifB/PqqE/SkfB family radical SAM enzyme